MINFVLSVVYIAYKVVVCFHWFAIQFTLYKGIKKCHFSSIRFFSSNWVTMKSLIILFGCVSLAFAVRTFCCYFYLFFIFPFFQYFHRFSAALLVGFHCFEYVFLYFPCFPTFAVKIDLHLCLHLLEVCRWQIVFYELCDLMSIPFFKCEYLITGTCTPWTYGNNGSKNA